MAIFELWLADQQIGSDFKSEAFYLIFGLKKKTLYSEGDHMKPCAVFFNHFKHGSFLPFSARSINRKERFNSFILNNF